MACRRAKWPWIGFLALVGLLYLIARLFLVQTFVITSDSMGPTLLEGDFVVVNRAAIGARIPFTNTRLPGYLRPAFGDVFVFDDPFRPGSKIVKRLVGLPGDTVEMRARVLYWNGEPQEEPYASPPTHRPDEYSPLMLWQQAHVLDEARADYRPSRDNWGPIVVPAGSFFMLGDNRDRSVDSRHLGFVAGTELLGKVGAIYFSYGRASHVSHLSDSRIRTERIGRLCCETNRGDPRANNPPRDQDQ